MSCLDGREGVRSWNEEIDRKKRMEKGKEKGKMGVREQDEIKKM